MYKETTYIKEDKKFEKSFVNGLAFLLVLSGIVLIVIFVTRLSDHFSIAHKSSDLDMAATGQVGDFIGGVAGTLFSLVGILLLIMTLKEQRESFQRERFETRFFELLKVYKSNIDEMNIAGTQFGRKFFLAFFKEFKTAYEICAEALEENGDLITKSKFSEIEKHEMIRIYGNEWEKYIKAHRTTEIAYTIFLYGIGNLSYKLYPKWFLEIPNFTIILDKFTDYQEQFNTESSDRENKKFNDVGENFSQSIKLSPVKESDVLKFPDLINSKQFIPNVNYNSDKVKRENPIYDPVSLNFYRYDKISYDLIVGYIQGKEIEPLSYYPFDGHLSRLGHYYRFLFQIVRYVVAQENILFSRDEIQSYLDILRSQMSVHEQLMLYYNIVSGFGQKWLCDDKNNNANYPIDYKMIHNIPLGLADFGIPPAIYFANEMKNGLDIFEWDATDYIA